MNDPLLLFALAAAASPRLADRRWMEDRARSRSHGRLPGGLQGLVGNETTARLALCLRTVRSLLAHETASFVVKPKKKEPLPAVTFDLRNLQTALTEWVEACPIKEKRRRS